MSIYLNQKKGIKIKYKVKHFARDQIVNNILNHFGMTNSLMVYNFLTTSPLEIVAQILTAKFGLSKAIVTIIIIFLL